MAVSEEDLRGERIRRERDFYLDPVNLLDFIRDFGAAPDAEEWPHGAGLTWLHDWKSIVDPATGQKTHLKKLVLWPRGSFKSQVLTIGYVAYRIAANPNIRAFVASETSRQARKFGKAIMRIVSSPKFIELFGDHRGPHWSEAGGTFTSVLRERQDVKDPTLACFGVGEVQTGAHWDLGAIDDPISQENTKTQDSILGIENWLGEMFAQLDPGAQLFMVGTHHHHSDYYAKVKRDEELRKRWEISSHAWKDEGGKLFFPKRLTETHVAHMKAELSPRLFACFFENRPASSDDQIFLPEYLHVVRDEEIPLRSWTYILTDFAFKSLQLNDRTCFWVVSLDPNRVAYVREVYVGRLKPSDSVRMLCALWDRYLDRNVRAVTIEVGAHQELISGLLEEVRRETFTRPRVVTIMGRSEVTKNMRIEGIEPRFRAGNIYFAQSFVQGQPRMWQAVTRELVEWPFSQHDDVPDAISDLDQKDTSGKFYLPGPPPTWQPVRAPTHAPTMVDGRFNKTAPVGDLYRRVSEQQVNKDLWQQGNRGSGDLFGRRG